MRVLDGFMTSRQLILLASAIFTLLFNFPFLSGAYGAIAPNTLAEWAFFLTIPVLLICLTIVFLTVIGGLVFPRFSVALSFVIGALLLYANQAYGIIFDKSMILNVMETNSGEVSSYLSLSSLGFFFVCGLLPAAIVLRLKLKGRFSEHLSSMLKLNVVALIGIVLVASLLYKDFAAVGRNNKSLTKYLIPYAFYNAGYKYIRDAYLYPPLPFRELDSAPSLAKDALEFPHTLVVVVGETARADNFGLNGYERQTTPNLSKENVVSFSAVTSCGTATAVSVPCMFSRLGRIEYNNRVASSQDNVLDILNRAGVDVTWIDNNSSCKGVCARIDTIAFDPEQKDKLCDGDYCFDEILLKRLDEHLSYSDSRNRVIVLHMIGSHGPTYYRRYPSDFKIFMPDCPQSDIQNCSEGQLVNTYDNTIVYTDYILSQVIHRLENIPHSAMLYISDHGESLGEKGLYLHGFPYKLAPEEQTHVPLVLWDSDFKQASYQSCVTALSDELYSQDNLYDTLLGLTHVLSITYKPELDILQSCHS